MHAFSIEATVAVANPYPANSLAARWVAHAIFEGRDPKVRQQGLSEADAGEWRIVTLKGAGNAALPEELWDDVFTILTGLGRFEFSDKLRVWHGDCLADNCSPEAQAFRVRLARHALSADYEAFYEPLGLDKKAGQAFEVDPFSLQLDDDDLERLCEWNTIPFQWLAYGIASEIHANRFGG